MRLTLKTKIALLGTALVVVLVAAFGLWQDGRIESDFRRLLQAQQDALAQVVANDLDDKLETSVKVLAHSALAVDAALLADGAARERFVSQQSAARPLFDGFALIGRDGEVLLNDPPLPAGTRLNVADRDYVKAVLATGRPAISRPLVTRSTGRPSLLIAAPVLDAHGRVIGLLGGGINLLRRDFLGKIDGALQDSLITVATRGDGAVYVYHPDPARVLEPVERVFHPGDIVSSHPIRVAGWELQVRLPAAQASAPVDRARKALFKQLALLAAAASVLLWLTAHALLRPLSALRDTMRDLGDTPGVEVLVDASHDDERGDLAREFQTLMRRLRDQQAELAAVSDASPLGMFRAATDGRMIYVNDAYLEIHDIERADAADGWLSRVPEAQRSEAWAAWQAIVSGEAPSQSVQRRVRPDGRELMVSLRSAPVMVDGRVAGHVGTLRDVTDAVRDAEALQRSEATLRGVAESMPAIVAVLDRDQRLRFTNSSFERWYGTDRPPALGLDLREVLGEAQGAAAQPAISRALAGERVQIDFVDRRQAHFDVTLVPLRLDDGTRDGAVLIASDITAHKQEAKRLRELTRSDPLTGVLNRAGFERHLERRLANRRGRGVALLYIDLDRFKPVNDTHGHPVGDELLRLFAERLRALVRPSDAVARLGGDEFAIVLDGLRERANAEHVSTKVLDAANAPFAIGGRLITIGASIGIAFVEDGDADWQALTARADALLYRAKHAGRGRVSGHTRPAEFHD